jgi:outer membrane immunogenic protein
MIYATGGLAYGRIETSARLSIAGTSTTCPPFCDPAIAVPFASAATLNESDTRIGWTVGAGMEGALFSSPNWRWKAEYLYLDLGKVTYKFNTTDFGPVTITSNVTDHIGRVGVNYRF